MFADKLTEKFYDGGMPELLDGARMVAIHPDVVEAAMALLEKADDTKMESVSRFTCWPDYNTWLEFKLDGCDVGMFFHGERGQSVLAGHGMITIDFHDGREPSLLPIFLDLPRYRMEFCDIRRWASIRADELGIDRETRKLFNLLEPTDAALSGDPILQQVQMAPFVREFKPLLLTLLAFMNSPKLIRTREVDMARFNARRLKRGKYPYHPHHEVRLNIDKHSVKIHAGAGRRSGALPALRAGSPAVPRPSPLQERLRRAGPAAHSRQSRAWDHEHQLCGRSQTFEVARVNIPLIRNGKPLFRTPPEQVVREGLDGGLSYKQISKRSGIPLHAVDSMARAIHRERREPITPERAKRIALYMHYGMTRRTVQKTFHIGNTEINRILRDNSVE